jgi:hypothetical protein
MSGEIRIREVSAPTGRWERAFYHPTTTDSERLMILFEMLNSLTRSLEAARVSAEAP